VVTVAPQVIHRGKHPLTAVRAVDRTFVTLIALIDPEHARERTTRPHREGKAVDEVLQGLTEHQGLLCQRKCKGVSATRITPP
jgi:hypothetical protein